MNILVTEDVYNYDGAQLAGGWLEETFGIKPDGCVAFRGACDVTPEHMIDLDDLKDNCTIIARDMVHFIAEFCEGNLHQTVLLQRLFICNIREVLLETYDIKNINRRGDDLFIKNRKFTVSIATNSKSAGTGLIHTGVNVDFTGAPVDAIGLLDLDIPPTEFASNVLARFSGEFAMANYATTKVRPAK